MVRIVPAVEDDISRIAEIEADAFAPPWTVGALLSELYREDSFFAVACISVSEKTNLLRHSALDAESHQQPGGLRVKPEMTINPCGYGYTPESGILEPVSPSVTPALVSPASRSCAVPVGFVILRCFADDGELLQIAVDRDARRCGVADLLLNAALEYSQEKNLRAVFLEVRKSNDAAVALYKKHGFKSVRLRKDYYSNPLEDALVMTKEQ
jgi:ribosomal-protein-alanine acetyltransferase